MTAIDTNELLRAVTTGDELAIDAYLDAQEEAGVSIGREHTRARLLGWLPPESPLRVRWMIGRDMPEVLAIESACRERPWQKERFLKALRQRNVVGMVADNEANCTVDGFVVYNLIAGAMRVVHIASNRGGMVAMIAKLLAKLNTHRRREVLVNVNRLAPEERALFLQAGFARRGNDLVYEIDD